MHSSVLCSFCCYSILLVDYGCYILARREDGPCEYSTWIIVVVSDLGLRASLKLFVGWVGHCSARIFSESASSKFFVHLGEKVVYCWRFEKTSVRIARSISAICLLVIFVVVACDVLVIQPFSDQDWVPVVRYHRISQYEEYEDFLEEDYLSRSSWMVSSVGVFMQIHGNWDYLTCWSGFISSICTVIPQNSCEHDLGNSRRRWARLDMSCL